VDRKPNIADLVHYDEFGHSSPALPEKKLIGAIILRAVLDYHSTAIADRHAKRSARLFLFSDNRRVSNLRAFMELLYSDPDVHIRRLRAGVLDGTIRPQKVVVE
jgi:hypothetical protein